MSGHDPSMVVLAPSLSQGLRGRASSLAEEAELACVALAAARERVGYPCGVYRRSERAARVWTKTIIDPLKLNPLG
jgi:hypothetical protein